MPSARSEACSQPRQMVFQPGGPCPWHLGGTRGSLRPRSRRGTGTLGCPAGRAGLDARPGGTPPRRAQRSRPTYVPSSPTPSQTSRSRPTAFSDPRPPFWLRGPAYPFSGPLTPSQPRCPAPPPVSALDRSPRRRRYQSTPASVRRPEGRAALGRPTPRPGDACVRSVLRRRQTLLLLGEGP
jgi:hypothetical protein